MNNYSKCQLLLNNFKRRLTNYKDIPADFTGAYRRFAEAMNKLLNYQITGNSKYLEDLEIFINKPGLLPAYSWFRKKINSLG